MNNQMNKIIKSGLGVVLALTMGSCHIYQKYDLPDNNIRVDEYRVAVEQNDTTGLAYMGWENIFTNPELQRLIKIALENNKDLNNARLNVDIARAQLKGAKLSYFPSATLSPNVGTASYGGSHMQVSYTIPVALNWEIDAFGKILNRKRGAKASVEQTEAYTRAVQSQIICGVANTYYALVLLQNQLDLTRRTSEIWAEQVNTMKLMKNAGMTTEAAVVQSAANYYSILSNIPELEESIYTTKSTLELLLNTRDANINVGTDLNFSLPLEFSNGVPLSYLAARPDVEAAERSLAIAYYSTNSARAAFYPSINISSNGGFTNLLGSIITNPGKWFIQLAGSLTAPLFSRGQNIATLEAAKAQQKQALNNFEYTVLNASTEVSDALVKIKTNEEKRGYIMSQIENLEKSVEYSEKLFTLNKGTYLELLTARSSLLNAQMSALACSHAKVAALISLYQAVGGGR